MTGPSRLSSRCGSCPPSAPSTTRCAPATPTASWASWGTDYPTRQARQRQARRLRRDLLASLDEAGAGQADPGGDLPHAYIPAGPVEAAPYLGHCPPEVRQEAFAAVLDGVETGAYDLRIIAWLAQSDDTCRTIASLMWRCRLAGAATKCAGGSPPKLTDTSRQRNNASSPGHRPANPARGITAGILTIAYQSRRKKPR
jgi:hypothetical protein